MFKVTGKLKVVKKALKAWCSSTNVSPRNKVKELRNKLQQLYANITDTSWHLEERAAET